eukprot:4393905-Pleurochrysis_carterae.AAC.2
MAAAPAMPPPLAFTAAFLRICPIVSTSLAGASAGCPDEHAHKHTRTQKTDLSGPGTQPREGGIA